MAPVRNREEEREEADRRLARALEERGMRDPRDLYRTGLQELRRRAPERYREAVEYYEETLVPAIALEDADPLHAWIEYGTILAGLQAEGRTVQVDPDGVGQPAESPPAAGALVLHLPDARGERAFPVAVPAAMSPAQQATFDLLVAGRKQLRDE